MVSWIWILVACFTGGFLGFLTAAMFASTQIKELKLWNRRFQDERDKFRKQRDEVVKINRELMKVEQ